jgi:flagellar motility protein MotE (MotC chaperone)
MKKIASLFLLICVLNLLALGGLAGYLVATDRLDAPKAAAIVDLLRHQGTPVKFRETLYDILQPAPATTSAPASQPAMASADAPADSALPSPPPGTAQDRINAAHEAVDQQQLRLENEAQELRHRQELLVKMQADVTAQLKQVKDEKEAFEKRVAQAGTQATDDNFQKTLALYDELKSKQVKDLFMNMQVEEIAKYITAMDPDRAGKIIGEFKTPQEANLIAKVLEHIRAAGTASASGTSTDTNAVAATPAPSGP